MSTGFKVEPKDRMESTFSEINTLWQVLHNILLAVVHEI